MKVLISAFEPFGGENLNPSSLLLEKLPNFIEGIELIKLVLPVTFNESSQLLTEAIEQHTPDYVLSLGQAGGRSALSIEKIGINLNEAPIPDNSGNQPRNERICAHHSDGYFTTLPIENMLNSCKAAKIPCQISYSAGTYVCNHVMFSALAFIQEKALSCKSGFVHIPYIPEQVLDKPNQASMDLSTMIEGIRVMIGSFLEQPNSAASSFGATH